MFKSITRGFYGFMMLGLLSLQVQAVEGIDRLLMADLNAWKGNIYGDNGTYLLGYEPLP